MTGGAAIVKRAATAACTARLAARQATKGGARRSITRVLAFWHGAPADSWATATVLRVEFASAGEELYEGRG
jgi:hypothetical protein